MTTPGAGASWSGGWNEPGIQQLIIVQTGVPNSGLFVYSGTPALGNPPIFNITPPGTTKDPYGNTIIANSYVGTNGAVIFNASVPEIDINDASNNLIGLIKGIVVNPKGMILQGAGTVSLQTATGTGSIFLGDTTTANRITLNGPVAPINAPTPGAVGTPEGWHAMTSLQNSWTATAGRVTPQYRLVSSPPNSVEVIGAFTAPAGVASGQAIWNVPSGYQLADGPQPIVARNSTTNVAVMLSVSSGTGALSYQGTSMASGNNVDFHGFLAMDA